MKQRVSIISCHASLCRKIHMRIPWFFQGLLHIMENSINMQFRLGWQNLEFSSVKKFLLHIKDMYGNCLISPIKKSIMQKYRQQRIVSKSLFVFNKDRTPCSQCSACQPARVCRTLLGDLRIPLLNSNHILACSEPPIERGKNVTAIFSCQQYVNLLLLHLSHRIPCALTSFLKFLHIR